jgi:UDP-GlcNAc:undecaprenyl-phosphate GlcNAc-1-phosphate transferase
VKGPDLTTVLLLTILLPAATAFAATPLMISLSWRFRFLDRPGPGKIHEAPAPNLGGLAIVAGVLGALFALEPLGLGLAPHHTRALALAALPLVLVGLADDLVGQSIPLKLLGHALAGLVLYLSGIGIFLVTNPFGDAFPLGPLALPATLVFVVAITNAMNLCDGLDGLAAGIAGIAAFSLAIVGGIQGADDVRVLGLVIAGAVVGFYPFNLPKARIFLGDVGSTFLGLSLATLALIQDRKAAAAITLLVPIMALGLPLADTLLAILRRTAHGRSILKRDLGHLHHRFLRLGLAPRQVLALLLGLTAGLGASAIAIAEVSKQVALLVALGVIFAGSLGLLGLVRLERDSARRAGEGHLLQKV